MDTKSEEKEYYSLTKSVFAKLAPFYDLAVSPFNFIRDKVVNFTNINDGGKVLDVATGTGKQAFAFVKKGLDVTGVDISEDMLKEAIKKKRNQKVTFHYMDATNLSFKDNTFDVTTISFALHDMPQSIRVKVLRQMNRVTKTDGKIIIVDYSAPRNSLWRFITNQLIKLYEGQYYVNFIKADLVGEINGAGMDIVNQIPILWGAVNIMIAGKGIKK